MVGGAASCRSLTRREWLLRDCGGTPSGEYVVQSGSETGLVWTIKSEIERQSAKGKGQESTSGRSTGTRSDGVYRPGPLETSPPDRPAALPRDDRRRSAVVDT